MTAMENQNPEYSVRVCSTVEDFAACIELQRKIWRFADLELMPPRAFVIARRNGGATLGAFAADGRLLGFSHLVPAIDADNRPYYYSQMTAVDKGLQNAGIGLQLKLAQRELALKRGITLITWTFDPLQSRNAHFNLAKLGGVVRTYCVNYYGKSTSELDRGLDTDRLFVEWWIRSEHVARALTGHRRADAPVATIEIPAEVQSGPSQDMTEERQRQLSVRDGFQRHLAAGLYCAGFERGRAACSRYLFFQDTRSESQN
jgi:predicted GNAT superfamily acetyltransferase